MTLPPYSTRDLILERLLLIFPEGTPQRQYVTREIAASTIFAFIYFGAVEGNEEYLGPLQIYRMTFEQAALSTYDDRMNCLLKSKKKGYQPEGKRWYADNSREPIRDETIREGFVHLGVVLELSGLPTTSSKPRYFLTEAFSKLFDPELTGDSLQIAIKTWRECNLSTSAIARLRLAAHTANINDTAVLIRLFNGETRKISAGPSSIISKQVIEEFAPRFLSNPALLWLSVSDDKINDDKLAKDIGLNIQADKDLPDLILVDLGPGDPLIVFIEVVATDGAISPRRQSALYNLIETAGFRQDQVAFVTAYSDRQGAGYAKTGRNLAWNSFTWFASEPESIVHWSSRGGKLNSYL